MIINNIRVLTDSLNEVGNNFATRYKIIIDTSKEYIKMTKGIIQKVQDIIDNVSSNINKLEYKAEELQRKLYALESDMNHHYSNYESYQREAEAIYNAGHWETITSYDENGNESTESFYDYDYEAHSRALKNADEEFDEYNRIKEIYDRVHEVYLKIMDELEYLYAIKNAFSNALDKINECFYNMNKYIDDMEKEIDYNVESLSRVLQLFTKYQGLKKFWYDNVTSLHSMFPQALLGVMQTYNNVFYDTNHADKINVSLNKINYAFNEVLNLETNIKDSIRCIDDVLSSTAGMVDDKLDSLFKKYLNNIKDFEKEVENVRSDAVLCFDMRRNEVQLYQNFRYMKSKIN